MKKTQSQNLFKIVRDEPFAITFDEAVRKLKKLGIIKIQAIGASINKAIGLSEKLVNDKQAIYIRFLTDEVINSQTKQIKVAVQIQLKYRSKQDQNQTKNYVHKNGQYRQKQQTKAKPRQDKQETNNNRDKSNRDYKEKYDRDYGTGNKRQFRNRDQRS